MKRALISGITGQDGSYLAELLLSKGYEVHGLVRRASLFNTGRIDHLYEDPHEAATRLFLHHADLSDGASISEVLSELEFDEVYNLGAQSHVRVSFDVPEYTGAVSGLGVTRILESLRGQQRRGRTVRFYQASSSEIFGSSPPPQAEDTPYLPRSPYACAKLYAHHMTRNYREAYGLFAVNGILFNHESERRGETFVSRKITRAVGRIVHGTQRKLYLGNLEASRDWGFAGDYVEAMWRMLQADAPSDYVIGTGECHTVAEFAELAFGLVGLDWRQYVEIDPRYFRPTEVDALCADSSKARRELGWAPTCSFGELVRRMVTADLRLAAREKRADAAPPLEAEQHLVNVARA